MDPREKNKLTVSERFDLLSSELNEKPGSYIVRDLTESDKPEGFDMDPKLNWDMASVIFTVSDGQSFIGFAEKRPRRQARIGLPGYLEDISRAYTGYLYIGEEVFKCSSAGNPMIKRYIKEQKTNPQVNIFFRTLLGFLINEQGEIQGTIQESNREI